MTQIGALKYEKKKKFPKIAATKHIISARRSGQGNTKLKRPANLKGRITRYRRGEQLHGLREKLTGSQLVKKSPYFMETKGS
jgi:hypothetical protein